METQEAEQAGYTVKAFAAKTAVSTGLLYKLPESLRPHAIKIGSRLVITEPPSAWLKRVGRAAGQEPLSKE